MKTIAEFDRSVYELAKEYLPSLNIQGVTQTLIESYLNPTPSDLRPNSKSEIYLQILHSAQNANMKAGVIGGSIGGVEKLAPILNGFDPGSVIAKYGNNTDAILDTIVAQLKPRGQIRRTSRSIWPNYCRTIASAAAFVEQFVSVQDFFDWIDFFDRDARARASLPMLLSREIEGFGFALACDFLKELGYLNFPKPDVHLRDIFSSLALCRANADDYALFKTIIRVANHANVTAYNADKLFWLIGSGYFYLDKDKIGLKGRIGSQKDGFIELAKSRMTSTPLPIASFSYPNVPGEK